VTAAEALIKQHLLKAPDSQPSKCLVSPQHARCCLQVTAAEGFGKTRLFEILDDLEEKTRPIMQEARQRLAKEKGEAALEPHNMGFALAGEPALCSCPAGCTSSSPLPSLHKSETVLTASSISRQSLVGCLQDTGCCRLLPCVEFLPPFATCR
jgi:hypothetical protein